MRSVFAWVEPGEPVGTSRRGRIIALLFPPLAAKLARPKKRPDFAARLKRIYGDLVLPGDVVVEERESRPERARIGATPWTFDTRSSVEIEPAPYRELVGGGSG